MASSAAPEPLLKGTFASCSKIKGLKTTFVSLIVEDQALGILPLDAASEPGAKDGLRLPMSSILGSQLIDYKPQTTYHFTANPARLRKSTSFTDESGQKLMGDPLGRKASSRASSLQRSLSVSSGRPLGNDIGAYFSVSAIEVTYVKQEKEKLKEQKVRDYIFRVDSRPTKAGNEALATHFRDTILKQTALRRSSTKAIDFFRLDLSKPVLLIVNPKSGPGKSLKILKSTVLPMFQKSNLPYDLIVTKRANHARDLIAGENLARWSALVILSGDGLLYEGLFIRSDWATFAKQLPVGIIAGGSGNGLARTLTHEDSRVYDDNGIVGSTLAVIEGRTRPMDMICVESKSGKRYLSFLSVGWGFLSDCDIESEKLRALGEMRFALWAGVRLAKFRTYRGKLSYIKAEPVAQQSSVGAAITVSADSGLECDLEPSTNFSGPSAGQWREQSEYENVSGHRLHFPESGCAPPFKSSVPDSWTTIEDDFVLIYAVNAAYIAADLNVAPKARLADGVMWLVVVRKGISKARMLTALSALEKGEMGEQKGVELFPVKAFRLEPLCSKGYITIDGEVADYESFQAELRPGLVRVIH